MTTTSISSKEGAYKLLSKIKALRDDLAQFDQRTKSERDARVFTIAQQERGLEVWAANNLPNGTKTIDLMVGKVSFRTVNGGLRVVNKSEATGWALANKPEFVQERTQTTQVLDSKALLAALAETLPEDLPPGVDIIPDEERFNIDLPAPAEDEVF
jgi:hypothetical protein